MRHRNLASERVRIGITQEKMAEKLGISTSTLVRYENNAETMPPNVLMQASSIFGCSTDYLLDLSEERTR